MERLIGPTPRLRLTFQPHPTRPWTILGQPDQWALRTPTRHPHRIVFRRQRCSTLGLCSLLVIGCPICGCRTTVSTKWTMGHGNSRTERTWGNIHNLDRELRSRPQLRPAIGKGQLPRHRINDTQGMLMILIRHLLGPTIIACKDARICVQMRTGIITGCSTNGRTKMKTGVTR
jgi:hypothetical protein